MDASWGLMSSCYQSSFPMWSMGPTKHKILNNTNPSLVPLEFILTSLSLSFLEPLWQTKYDWLLFVGLLIRFNIYEYDLIVMSVILGSCWKQRERGVTWSGLDSAHPALLNLINLAYFISSGSGHVICFTDLLSITWHSCFIQRHLVLIQ